MGWRVCVLQWVLTAALMCPSITARSQLFERTDPQREIELGRQVAREVERELPLSRDPMMQERVQRIGAALVRAMPQKAYPYEFKTLEVREFNAFCLPGGFMYVYEGLLSDLSDDDAVAFVMAHEITHAAHRHWHRIVEKMRGPVLLAILAGTLTGAGDVAELATTLIGAQYSREQEVDADRGGIELMWAAGYDVRGAVRAAKAMAKLEEGREIPVYLRSHPPAKDRVRALEQAAQELAQTPRPQQSLVRGNALATDERRLVGEMPSDRAASCKWQPMDIGNRWEYIVYRSDIGTARTVTYSVNVCGRLPTPRGDVWRVSVSVPDQPAVTQQWLTTATALWIRGRPEVETSKWNRAFVFEPSLPATAEWSAAEGGPLEVPGGIFSETLVLRKGQGDEQVEVWFAAGVGMVKRVSGGGRVVELLRRYRLARTPADQVPFLSGSAGG